MKFICSDCDKQFLYTAKLTKFIAAHDVELNEDEVTQAFDTEETHVCPYCHSLNISEAQVEQIQQPKMVDLVECEVPHVKEYLDKGYVVLDRYAKSIRLALYQQAKETAQN